jgi:hypothetical protein
VNDILDVVLHEQQTVDELRLVTELMVVASMADSQLEEDVIDTALGIERAPRPVPSQRSFDQPG